MSEDSKLEWPKRIDLYVHSCDDGCDDGLWNTANDLGLQDEAQSLFSHILDEFKLTFDINEDGSGRLIAIDGKLVLDKQLSDYYEDRANAQRQD